MRYWCVLVPADRFEAERLYLRDSLVISDVGEKDPDEKGLDSLDIGDRVALLADTDPPIVFALGAVSATVHDDPDAETGHNPDDPASAPTNEWQVAIEYAHRLFDTPLPFPESVALEIGAVTELEESGWQDLDTSVARSGSDVPEGGSWLVSLDLPIEATSAAEAVRQFWTYVLELGPRELPAFVSPAGNELAMQAMIGGVPVNLDPEEDEQHGPADDSAS